MNIANIFNVIEKNKLSVLNIAIIGAANPAEVVNTIKNSDKVKAPVVCIEIETGIETNLFTGHYTISEENKDIVTTLVPPPIEACIRTGGTVVISGNIFKLREVLGNKDSIENIINTMICMNYLELRNGTIVRRHRECTIILLLDKENHAPEKIMSSMDLIVT